MKKEKFSLSKTSKNIVLALMTVSALSACSNIFYEEDVTYKFYGSELSKYSIEENRDNHDLDTYVVTDKKGYTQRLSKRSIEEEVGKNIEDTKNYKLNNGTVLRVKSEEVDYYTPLGNFTRVLIGGSIIYMAVKYIKNIKKRKTNKVINSKVNRQFKRYYG